MGSEGEASPLGNDCRRKILQHDDHVQKRLNLLDSLIGNSRVANDLKGSYVPMILNSNVDLVQRRGTGMDTLSSKKMHLAAAQKSKAEINRATSINQVMADDQANLTYLATNGGAQANFDPVRHIEKLIQHQKPNLQEACDPDQFYKNQARVNPKHIKKLYSIEDIVQKKAKKQI